MTLNIGDYEALSLCVKVTEERGRAYINHATLARANKALRKLDPRPADRLVMQETDPPVRPEDRSWRDIVRNVLDEHLRDITEIQDVIPTLMERLDHLERPQAEPHRQAQMWESWNLWYKVDPRGAEAWRRKHYPS